LLVIVGVGLAAGCAAQTVKSHALSQTDKLETELVRGVSTRADVLSLLGEPDGSGEFGGWHGVRGPEHAKKGPAEAWYYEASGATIGAGVTERIQVLLVFFFEDSYDGFYWFTAEESGDWQ
jgi:hypothetical protein